MLKGGTLPQKKLTKRLQKKLRQEASVKIHDAFDLQSKGVFETFNEQNNHLLT